MVEEFKKELKALLKKYNAILSLDYADCSDTYGMYDERMTVHFRDANKTVDLADGYCLDASDL
jgi:hypothetical protein